jgi:hypothetical protein
LVDFLVSATFSSFTSGFYSSTFTSSVFISSFSSYFTYSFFYSSSLIGKREIGLDGSVILINFVSLFEKAIGPNTVGIKSPSVVLKSITGGGKSSFLILVLKTSLNFATFSSS